MEYEFSKSDFLEILDSSTEGSFIHDLEKNEIYFSDKWKTRLGIVHMSPKEAVSSITDLVHPDDQESMHKAYIQAIEKTNPNVKMEFRVRTADSGYIWILGQGKIIYNQESKPIKYYGTHMDISEQKRMEESIKESEQLYRTLFENTDDSFIIIDPIYDKTSKLLDFTHIKVNNTYLQDLGLKETEVIGKNFKQLYPDIENYWLDNNVLKTGKSKHEENYCKYNNRWYDVFSFPCGKGHMGVLFRDITDKKHMEADLHTFEKNLKLQDEIYSNISHELKTPLNVIFSTEQLMELYLKDDSIQGNKEKLQKGLHTIKQNCYRFTKLINNIVDLSKMDSGVFKLNLRNENIVEIVENIVQSVVGYTNERGVNITFDTDTEEKIIACDAIKIERIILNFISNAIKFTNVNGNIFVNVMDKGDFVEIAIRDTGVGIDKENLDLIFKKYYQVNKTLSRNLEGTGIGLSIVKNTVEMHGGKISVESEVGEGSTFRIELPAATIPEQENIRKTRNEPRQVEMIHIEFSDIYNF